ncbi:MAG TPA: response regulator transcription factor, partial [Bacteroidota bacterium]
MKFLIVDDNSIMRQTIRRVVQRGGDEIIECDDGKDALEMYERYHPDWVLMDISMKDVNGIEATERITQAYPAAKVVVVTDYVDRFFQRAAKEAGAFAFVSKENLGD